MNKLRILTLLMIAGILCTCASGGKAAPVSSGPADLDTAIQLASKEINDALPQGTKVALLNFTSESDVFSDYVLEEMSIALVQGRKLTVVDRKDIDLIRGEMNFQMSGEVSDASAQEIGAMLGAQSIVSGSLVHMGENYRFRTKAINVVSAAIQTSSSLNVVSDSQIQYLLSQGNRSPAPQAAVAQGGAQAGSAQAVPAQAGNADQSQPAAPALIAYKIGDTGPAGGLIFYDKGNNSGGWRYLEAAPEEVEFRAKWSVHRTEVENTVKTIGAGKRNTQLIVTKLSQISGEWDTAAQKVDELVFNGFDDWFLPSSGELDMMYGNLKRRNLGDFKNEWYWSSSFERYWADRQNFRDGKMETGHTDGSHYVRPIRQIAGPAGGAASSSANGVMGDDGAPVAKKSGASFWGVLTTLLGIGLIGFLVYLVIVAPSEPATAN